MMSEESSLPDAVVQASEAVQTTLDAALAHVDALAALHAHLATTPDLCGDRFANLLQHQQQTSTLLLSLGRAVVSWCRLGGSLVLEDPLEAAPPEIAPEPAAVVSEPTVAVAVVDEEEVVVPPMPPPAPATEASMSRLKEAFQSRTQFALGSPSGVMAPLPLSLLERLGEPPEVLDGPTWDRELHRLRIEVEGRQAWLGFEREVQRELVALLGARLRHLQDEAAHRSGRLNEPRSMADCFRWLTQFSAEHRPGSVISLNRKSRPSQPTWRQEALVWWRKLTRRCGDLEASSPAALLANLEEGLAAGLSGEALLGRLERLVVLGVSSRDERLLALVAPHAAIFEGNSRCRTLQKALKARLATAKATAAPSQDETEEEEEGEGEGEGEGVIVAELLEKTRGRRAIVVGGDQRSDARERLQAAFGFSVLEWETGLGLRRVQSLSDRVVQGGVDIVIFLKRFMCHSLANTLLPACKETEGVTVAWVERGYGVTAVGQSLARSFGVGMGTDLGA